MTNKNVELRISEMTENVWKSRQLKLKLKPRMWNYACPIS